VPTSATTVCPDCGQTLTGSELSCPACRSLLYARELEDLARNAQIAANSGNLPQAKDFWTQSLAYLPPETIQYRSIQARIHTLAQQIDAASPAPQRGWRKGATAGLGPVALALWKFKALLFGLAKMTTLLSMFVSFGFYWHLYGWALAAGLILSIYIHEMGHIIELRKFGIPAGAPMFIPGLGAIIQLRGVNLPPVQDARIGLAGPIYGFGAALVAYAVFISTGLKIWAAIANLGAVINLFNLIPIWQLDGARGFHSQTLFQRLGLLTLALALWAVTKESMYFLILLGGGYRLFKRDAAQAPDNAGFLQFAGLLLALGVLVALTAARST
jgi:Zn-dependent protease